MGLNKFIYFLLVCSVLVIFYEKEEEVVMVEYEEKPEVSFYNSTAYEITEQGVNLVVKSQEAYLYKNREELIEGTMISKGDQPQVVNIVSGNYFIKIENDLYIDGDVNLQLENSIEVQTEQLEYNTKTKIAKNSSPFIATQLNHTFKGDTITLDTQKRHITAHNTQMKIEVNDE